MSRVIGKEAREAIKEAMRTGDLFLRKSVHEALDRCTDAPEVGGAEPVANLPTGPWTWSPQIGKPGACHMAQVWDADGKSLVVVDSRGDPDEASAVAKFIAESRESAHPPEVGLPDVNWRAVVHLMRWTGKQVLAEPLMAAQLLSEADTLERWLESAGQEGQKGERDE